MTSQQSNSHAVAVIGAGPAGLYAAKQLAAAGHQVALINRDIKPGGLAEYGIYHDKHNMKNGLRKQFRKLLDAPEIHYFGNLTVSNQGDLTLKDIQALGFSAVIVTVGAQGTKWLGMPGEELSGVYHAKDLVYHYNQLPPYSQQEFAIGKRVACIGVGNVMLDIAHWTIKDLKVDEVTAVARRGPADVKFTKKEMSLVAKNLDLDALNTEIERTRPIMEAVNQSPEEAKAFILAGLEKAEEKTSETRFLFDFLASPKQILGKDGKVTGLEVEETTLELRNGGDTKAVNLGTTRVIDVDTVVFCIGDRVDADFGLPLDKWKEFAKHPAPKFPVNDLSFEAYDPEKGEGVEGVFLAGWAREASSGLVGSARKDGESGAKAAIEYTNTLPAPANPADTLAKLEARLENSSRRIIRKADWVKLEAVEAKLAEERGLPIFKFDSNEEMLEAIGG
ncbi:MAG: FAD-dependent oxidoreductase [Anaerolineae bacterium]|nr:FAD-dependent oxidoreductase [Anaerolineae bacterium]